MKAKEFFRLRAELDSACAKLLTDKNREYAEADDFLGNFNVAGSVLKQKPEIVAAVYLYKHFRSIFFQLSGGKMSAGENVLSRIRDARNYLDFLYALLKETR